ncbi:hypothetical protein, conserved [Eimeria maxima]|uniref:Uncharacterized protein n=1 Tax=Eimeria maxima TaxID=5804 RepID=U6M422_EIMMA|nr:hypothetical protein, conserved [Eimeria maxima]CDJ57174.1 hypothetical protein, conserved [Eimeria maxima]
MIVILENVFDQREGSLVFIEEEGLGRAADTLITAEQAAGGIRQDADELKKIESVLPTFTRPDHYADPDDRPGFPKGFIPDEEVSEYRKFFRWKQHRLYKHDKGQPIHGGVRRAPQPIP